jgi:hypothetical protein
MAVSFAGIGSSFEICGGVIADSKHDLASGTVLLADIGSGVSEADRAALTGKLHFKAKRVAGVCAVFEQLLNL